MIDVINKKVKEQISLINNGRSTMKNGAISALLEFLFYEDRKKYEKRIKQHFRGSRRKYEESFVDEFGDIKVISNDHCYSITESLCF